MTCEQFWKSVDSIKIMDSKLRVNFIRDDDPVIRPPLSPSVNQEQNAVKGQAWDKPSRVTNKVCMYIFSYFNFLTLVKYGQSHPKFGIQMPLLLITLSGNCVLQTIDSI